MQSKAELIFFWFRWSWGVFYHSLASLLFRSFQVFFKSSSVCYMGVRGLRGNSAHDELCTLMFRCLNDSKKGFGSFISGHAAAVRARPLTAA